MANKMQALSIWSAPFLLLPIGLAYWARVVFESQIVFSGVLLVAAIVGAIFYRVGLDSAVSAADRGRESMLMQLSRSEGPLSIAQHAATSRVCFKSAGDAAGSRTSVSGLTTLLLFFVAIANLFSKKIATIYGVSFTVVLYVLFMISERVNASKQRSQRSDLEKFNLQLQPQITGDTLQARPGCVLVGVRDYRRLWHLQKVLEKTNLRRNDIVVMTVRPVTSGAAEYDLRDDQLFADYEQELFSHVVTLAEKQGKRVELLVVPATDPFDAMVQTAGRLQASKLVAGVSARMTSEELASRIGLAWERLPEPRHPFSLEVMDADRPSMYVNLGPHPPRLWPEDVDRLHKIWLRLTQEERLGSKLHHRDVVGLALRRLEEDLDGRSRDQIVDAAENAVHRHE